MAILTTSRDIIRRLEAEGWLLVSTKGSHHKFRKGDRTVIVPHPKKDLPLGTARNIARFGARATPAVMSRLRLFRGLAAAMGILRKITWASGDIMGAEF